MCDPNKNAEGSKFTTVFAQVLSVSPAWLERGDDQNDETTSLGSNIKKFRLKAGLSQEELANLIGGEISQGAISALEKRGSASSKFAPQIANALGVSLETLLGEIDKSIDVEISKVDRIARALALMPEDRLDALALILGIKL